MTAAASGALTAPAAAQATRAALPRPSQSVDMEQGGHAMGQGGFSKARLSGLGTLTK
jgi:hypothetical protein